MGKIRFTEEDRKLLSEIGKRVRKDVENRPDWPQILKEMKAQGHHGKEGGKMGRGGRPRTATRVREIMAKHKCSRQWAYELLKKERKEQKS